MGIDDDYNAIKEEAERDFININEKLRESANAYYNEDRPIISDFDYDSLVMRARELEKQVSQAVIDVERLKKSPYFAVVGKPAKGLKTVEHKTPMLSLRTEVDTSQKPIEDFVERVENKLAEMDALPDKVEFVVEPKLDGLALSLIYKKGRLIRAATRGDGQTGEDVTHNALVIESIPKVLPSYAVQDIEVRGEVLMSKAVFSKLNAERELLGMKTYVNPRNAAAGSLRLHDSKEAAARGLEFIAYQAIELGEPKHLTHSSLLHELQLTGFLTPPDWLVTLLISEMIEQREKIEEGRADLPYEIDGVVYKVNSLDLQKKLGFVGKEPVWAIAHKFPPEEATAKIIAIDTQVGRTGFITPVAKLEPVFVGGTTVSNVTLNNVFDIRRKGVRVGDEVFVRRAGDVIPEITARVKLKRDKYLPNFKMPKACPVCGGLVLREKGTAKYRCTNTLGCYAQLKGALQHYCSRLCLDIEGFGEKTIDALVDNKVVSSVDDIYQLDLTKLAQAGITGKTAVNLLDAIDGSRVTTLARFLYGLGIRHVGEQTSKDLAEHFKTIDAFLEARYSDIASIKDIGAKTAQAIAMFVLDPRKNKMVKTAIKNGKLIIKHQTKELVVGKLTGKTFVVSGRLTHYELVAPSQTREKFIEELQKLGAVVNDKVSAQTTALIIGDKPSSKLAKAKSLGVPVLTDKEAMEQFLSLRVNGDMDLIKALVS